MEEDGNEVKLRFKWAQVLIRLGYSLEMHAIRWIFQMGRYFDQSQKKTQGINKIEDVAHLSGV